MRNTKTDFNDEISVIGFLFLPFEWEICKRIWKTVLKNSGLVRAHKISKKKTAVHENSFAKTFFRFPNRTVKSKSMKFRFGFLNWNWPWGQISRRWNPFHDSLQNPKARFQNLNPDFSIERNLSLAKLSFGGFFILIKFIVHPRMPSFNRLFQRLSNAPTKQWI